MLGLGIFPQDTKPLLASNINSPEAPIFCKFPAFELNFNDSVTLFEGLWPDLKGALLILSASATGHAW